MSGPMLIMIAVAGGVGAALRFLVDLAIQRRLADRSALPWGTMVINLSGSLLLGLITGYVSGHVDQAWATVAGVGLLGGYTTFSTASVETVRLLADRRYRDGLINGLGMLFGSVLLAYAGLLVGRLG
ncbi:fluoride efflux transporter FluC [Microlunatus speluncae]|uniref:fluoride efflux transporter FluC n=1 Tax=Microlunatus speluncae TaxID=2594267 RepID=UPI001478DDE3|nr:CrcB family protein [Microlunatus speluncae]